MEHELENKESVYRGFIISAQKGLIPFCKDWEKETFRLDSINCTCTGEFIQVVKKSMRKVLNALNIDADEKTMKQSLDKVAYHEYEVFQRFMFAHVPRYPKKFEDILGVMHDIIVHPERSWFFNLNLKEEDTFYFIIYS